ncbi:hypothetical protein [Haloarcula litorea]|uniref:hypothetical protein n=1 Tax=Haloarcula litorea TaxID=3032579 RepID=UPI0023E820D3|nr:hypothetical protein [Halomicroarcula sp. GDY20]
MQLAKVNSGHWKDSHEEGFKRRYEFANYLTDNDMAAISFIDDDPFNAGILEPETEVIENITKDELSEAYVEAGKNEGTAQNYAEQILRFRDVPVGTPIWLYVGRNMVYSLGKVTGEYEMNWDSDCMDEFGYPHHREVKWAETPRRFNRKHFLPEDLQNWLACANPSGRTRSNQELMSRSSFSWPTVSASPCPDSARLNCRQRSTKLLYQRSDILVPAFDSLNVLLQVRGSIIHQIPVQFECSECSHDWSDSIID